MKYGNKKIFLDKEKLYQMINWRINGMSLNSLALIFNCHKTSVEYQCELYHIEPREGVYDLERIVAAVFPKNEPPNFKMVNGERINLGRSYKDYFK